MANGEVVNFTVLCTVPSGEVKEYEWQILLGIVIDRNVSAHQIEKTFDMGPALMRGEIVDGSDINMKGYSFVKKGK